MEALKPFENRLRQAAAQVCAMAEAGELTEGSAADSMRVLFAPEAHAGEVLESLERIMKIRQSCDDPRYTDQDTHVVECCRWCKARAAIAKARWSPG